MTEFNDIILDYEIEVTQKYKDTESNNNPITSVFEKLSPTHDVILKEPETFQRNIHTL